MAQLIVRNIGEDVKARLRDRAARRGRSMEEEVREILRAASVEVELAPELLGTRIARRFEGIGLMEDIPELRGQEARPVEFGDAE